MPFNRCMSDQPRDLESAIELFIRRSQPIHWVNWMTRCSDREAKEKMKSVLFENGHLRDLTDFSVKEEVLHAVLTNEAIFELAIDDLAELEALEAENNPSAE